MRRVLGPLLPGLALLADKPLLRLNGRASRLESDPVNRAARVR